MEELKIIGWTFFDDVYPTKKVNQEELMQMLNLIKESIYENGYVFSGEEHQNCSTGVPVFSDGTCFRASMRAWGSIMCQMYSGPDGEELTYMDFYMSLGESSRLPEYVEITVEPAEVEEESVGCTIKQDKNMIEESLALGMSFITTDKVLKKLFEKLKNEK